MYEQGNIALGERRCVFKRHAQREVTPESRHRIGIYRLHVDICKEIVGESFDIDRQTDITLLGGKHGGENHVRGLPHGIERGCQARVLYEFVSALFKIPDLCLCLKRALRAIIFHRERQVGEQAYGKPEEIRERIVALQCCSERDMRV